MPLTEDSKFVAPIITALVIGLILSVSQIYIAGNVEKRITTQRELVMDKKEVFINAIQLIDRNFDSSNLTGVVGHIPTKDKPSTKEINDVYTRLLLVSDDMKIPKKFSEFFFIGKYNSMTDRGEFILLIRKELYNLETNEDPNLIPFFGNSNVSNWGFL